MVAPMRVPLCPSLLVVLVVTPLVLGPRVVRACSCAVGLNLALPTDGAEGVPTNTKIWLDGLLDCFLDIPTTWRLLDLDGVEIAYSSHCVLSRNSYDALLTLHPVEPLRPNTTYVVEESQGNPVLSFTTGSGPDHVAPGLPVEVDRDVVHGRPDQCDDSWTHLATITVDGEGALFVLNAGGLDALDVGAIAGEVSEMSGEPRLSLGKSGCHGDNFPGGASRRADTTVRHGAFDLAGNFSGWTEPQGLSLAGCSLAGQAGPGWLLWPLLLGRRRRLGLKRGGAAA